MVLIDGGGASGARDKTFQSSRQSTVHIKDFYVEWFGKLSALQWYCGSSNR